MNTRQSKVQAYQEFRKQRAAKKEALKAEARAAVKAARKNGEIKRSKPLKEIVNDFAFEF